MWMATVVLWPKEGVGFLAATNTGGLLGRKAVQQAMERLIEIHQSASNDARDENRR
jgi:hypothetical protein